MGLPLGLYATAFMFQNLIPAVNEVKLEELRNEYANLQNLPRKKKKREKKRILLDYAIFSWNPLEDLNL